MAKKSNDTVKSVEEMTDEEILTQFRNDYTTSSTLCKNMFEESKSFRAIHAANRCANTAMRAIRDGSRRGFTLSK